MKHKPTNKKTKQQFFSLFALTLSMLFAMTQVTPASVLFDFLTESFSFENLTNQNLFSPVSVFVVNTVSDTNDVLPGDGFCNDGAGNCSLRAAIQESNALAGAQIIDFDIPPGCGAIILPLSPLPDITDSVTIDGYSNPGANGNTAATGDNAVLCIEIDGTNAGLSADGLRIAAANTTVRGLVIGRFGDAGIEVNGSGAIIEGNFIGTESAGLNPRPNFHGVVVNASNSRIGGTTLLSRNIVSANKRFGIALSQSASGNMLQNNYVGVNSASNGLGNGETGISVFRSAGNTIGGATANVRNVISANGTTATGGLDGSGIYIFGSSPLGQAPNNLIQGNYVGTNPTGTAALGNKQNGVKIDGAINATITGNLVSGNLLDGITITGAGATGNVVRGNTIGLDANKFNAVPNLDDGIEILQVGGNTVGGTNAGDGNWIGGNFFHGVYIRGNGAENNIVQGNNIGFNTANLARANLNGGIVVFFTHNNVIGGTTANAGNYVTGSGNTLGIGIYGGNNNLVQGNKIGLTPSNTVLPNDIGIYLQDGTNNIFGGTAPGAGNLISGNTWGIRIDKQGSTTAGTQILGNYIGTNSTGTAPFPNTFAGIGLQFADGVIVGGTTAAARNIISGNTTHGVYMFGGTGNQIMGNYVGTTADGLSALPNAYGFTVESNQSNNNVIGGTATGAGNVISGNSNVGIRIFLAPNNRIEGNLIGQKADGSGNLPNQQGIYLQQTTGNIIGGTAANAGNVVSGNNQNGIVLTDGAFANLVQGNKIGSDANGTTARPNGAAGVAILEGAPTGTINNMIGGNTAGARNIISGNTAGGVSLQGLTTKGNLIQGNYVGAQADGVGYLGNASFGIFVNAPNNYIGGASTAQRNVISGQTTPLTPGILIGVDGDETVVQNNYIGTTADGSGYLYNGTGITCYGDIFTFDSNLISGSFYGVYINNATSGKIVNNVFGLNASQTAALGNGDAITLSNSSGVIIGDNGGTPAPNVIAGNERNGIVIVGSSNGNLISQNSIYNNTLLGIDLGGDGVTQNDDKDLDSGANRRQNFPVISNASTIISGSLNSTPNRSFRLEFFASPAANASGYGEGRTFLTNQTVTTDANGNATFSVANPQPLGSYIAATATDVTTSETSEFSTWKQTLAPTAVQFNSARATVFDNGVLVEWQTGREAGNLGFNVYRERTGGKRELVTPNLVAGAALTAGENLLAEQNYSWFDAAGDKNSSYFIEAVDLDGAKETYGAVQPETSAANGAFRAVNSETLSQLGQSETPATRAVEPTFKATAKLTKQQAETQNLLAAGKNIKIIVSRAGIYRVTAAKLFAAGLPENVAAANLQLFANGVEQPINVTGADGGIFDQKSAIEFYGTGTNTPETDARVFYLVVSPNAGRRMTKTDSQGSPTPAGFYNATVERRDRTIYFSGLLNGDEENFFGAVINNAGTIQTINAAQLAPNGGAAELEISLQGVTRNPHSVGVELNGQLVSTLEFTDQGRGRARISLTSSQLVDGENTVRLVANNQNDVSVVDYLRLTYPHLYRAENNSLSLTANGGQEITIGNFTSKNVRVFDVTNPNEAIELAAYVQKASVNNAKDAEDESSNLNSARNFAVRFTPAGTGPRNLLAVTDNQFAGAANISIDNPSNLRDGKQNAADLLIISRREFFDALAPLVKLRSSQGLIVRLVDVEDIYDEFSFGQKSSAAIKRFLDYAATNWARKPQFLLLAGDATYDPKGYLGNVEADIVQTRLVDSESLETASDEWLADFDDDGVGELAIGRLPVRSAEELAAMVEKIVGYERQTPSGSAAFVADINDGGYDFAAGNASVSALLPSSISVTDIRRENPDARSRFLTAINRGQSIISYAGHGSTGIWRGNLFTNTDAAGLTNSEKLPLFVMMTCLNGYFQNLTTDSLSEALLKNPRGGAVAVWASSGSTTPDVETELNRQFISALYGQNLTVGQAAQMAKRTVANTTLRQTWTLLGDPTMRLK